MTAMAVKTARKSASLRAPVRVRIVSDIENVRIPGTKMRMLVSQIIGKEGRGGTVQIIVVDDVTMRRLNRRFKGKDKTTDVLSFPFAEAMPGTESEKFVGEVYCNFAHCKRWVTDNGGSINDELLRLAVHGSLHLFGYDHHRPEDHRRMLRAENRYLATDGLIRTRVAAGERDED
jgi:probable rRNA maturation factor